MEKTLKQVVISTLVAGTLAMSAGCLAIPVPVERPRQNNQTEIYSGPYPLLIITTQRQRTGYPFHNQDQINRQRREYLEHQRREYLEHQRQEYLEHQRREYLEHQRQEYLNRQRQNHDSHKSNRPFNNPTSHPNYRH